jgi:vacuolar protein sorting-associated protein 54
LIDTFLIEVDKISKNKTATLRSWLQNQTNKFLSKFHTERKDKLVLAIESESWKATELPADFQKILDTIVKEFRNNPQHFTYIISCSSSSNSLYIDSEKYVFFGIVVILFRLLIEYIHLEKDIAGSSFDVMNKLIELFNVSHAHFTTYSCHLVF